MTIFALFPPGRHSESWLISPSGPLNADELRNAGVPDPHTDPGQWRPVERLSGVVQENIQRGRMLAERCPGVVFVGQDLRWLEQAPLFTWSALPGPQVPAADSVRPLAGSEALPTFADGVRLNATKVLVWARRQATDALIPLGFHVAAGVFDDADLPGMKVVGWLPLAPQPTPDPAPPLQTRPLPMRR